VEGEPLSHFLTKVSWFTEKTDEGGREAQEIREIGKKKNLEGGKGKRRIWEVASRMEEGSVKETGGNQKGL